MACPQCKGLESLFDRRTAEADLRRYHRRGPGRSTRILLDALKRDGIRDATLLDIGGGIGAIPLDLLTAGAASATDVDAASGYLAVAQEEAARRGLAERVTYHHGDFVTLAADVAPADIVTLDRVVCCYPDMRALVGASAAHARHLYGLVYPRDTWWTRLGGRIGNALLALTRRSFRFFVHPTGDVDAVIQSSGLRPAYQRDAGLLWQVVVYSRPTA